jgi:uncharacterized membrane protein YcaP (DUF421 family)
VVFVASILVRTLIVYILLSFSLRIMGRRQIGELDVSELISTLLVSEIASIPIDDPDIPLSNAVIPILFILSLEVILSTIKNKSGKLKSKIEGEPIYIIYKGRLLQKALKDNRISVNELISEIRAQGVGDISKVNYAILEQNGSLSVLSKNDSEMSHPLIIDGEINQPTLTAMGYNDIWLNKRLDEARVNQKDIFLMTVDDNGKIFIVERDINEGQDNSNSKSHRCAGGSGAKRSSIKKQN